MFVSLVDVTSHQEDMKGTMALVPAACSPMHGDAGFCGNNSVGRMLALGASCRGFESSFPHCDIGFNGETLPCDGGNGGFDSRISPNWQM